MGQASKKIEEIKRQTLREGARAAEQAVGKAEESIASIEEAKQSALARLGEEYGANPQVIAELRGMVERPANEREAALKELAAASFTNAMGQSQGAAEYFDAAKAAEQVALAEAQRAAAGGRGGGGRRGGGGGGGRGRYKQFSDSELTRRLMGAAQLEKGRTLGQLAEARRVAAKRGAKSGQIMARGAALLGRQQQAIRAGIRAVSQQRQAGRISEDTYQRALRTLMSAWRTTTTTRRALPGRAVQPRGTFGRLLDTARTAARGYQAQVRPVTQEIGRVQAIPEYQIARDIGLAAGLDPARVYGLLDERAQSALDSARQRLRVAEGYGQQPGPLTTEEAARQLGYDRALRLGIETQAAVIPAADGAKTVPALATIQQTVQDALDSGLSPEGAVANAQNIMVARDPQAAMEDPNYADWVPIAEKYPRTFELAITQLQPLFQPAPQVPGPTVPVDASYVPGYDVYDPYNYVEFPYVPEGAYPYPVAYG